jgi:hypothetical protein
LLPKTICLSVTGMGILSVNSVTSKNPSIICSLVVQLLSLSGVLLPLPSTLPLAPGSFTHFFWWFPQFIPTSHNTQIASLAAVCWAIWKLKNRACFERKLISSPFELISYAVIFMNYWAGLHGERDASDLRAGADGLMRLAAAGAGASSSGNARRAGPLRLESKKPEDTGDGNTT